MRQRFYGLDPARGIAIGLVIASALWGGAILFWALTGR